MQIHPIRKYRDEHGLSLDALASRLGIARSTLSKIELGQRGLSLPLAGKISENGIATLEELAAAAAQKREVANG